MRTRIAIVIAAAAGAILPAHADPAKPAKVAVCAACHGEDGASTGPTFPKLAGQQDTYIEHALHAYQTGERKNPIMAPQAASLSGAEIKELALWYAHQQPKVYVPDIEQGGHAKQ